MISIEYSLIKLVLVLVQSLEMKPLKLLKVNSLLMMVVVQILLQVIVLKTQESLIAITLVGTFL